MKTLATILLMLFCALCYGRVGDTLQDCKKRYGKIQDVVSVPGKENLFVFHKSGFRIGVSFLKGKVHSISYKKLDKTAISKEYQKKLLESNIKGDWGKPTTRNNILLIWGHKDSKTEAVYYNGSLEYITDEMGMHYLKLEKDNNSDLNAPPKPPVSDGDMKEVGDAPPNTEKDGTEPPKLFSINPTQTDLVLPKLYRNRTLAGKKRALRSYGGSSKTESAVIKGLRWLKEKQNQDGSWGDTKKYDMSAYTGLALLAFLAHGETPASVEFGDAVAKAIKSLMVYVGPNADRVKGGYRHGIVMYALAEAYAVTKIPSLKPVVEKGIARIVQGMNDAGSYDYGYKIGQRSDLSVAGWSYQALKAASVGGCKVKGLEDAIKKATGTGLKKTHWSNYRDMFTYSGNGGGAKVSMTAIGVYSLQLLGEGGAKQAKAGLKVLQGQKYFWLSWDKNPNSTKPLPWALYQWYYQTQAMFHGHKGKGSNWRKWNKMLATELVGKQKKDGSWVTPAFEHSPGGHGEGMFKGLDQKVYATSLCCLMLQVYYRHTP